MKRQDGLMQTQRKHIVDRADAQHFQRSLYDDLVRKAGSEAYAKDTLGVYLLCKRIEFTLRHLPQGAHVLDIGCGDGTVTKAVMTKAASAVGIDISPEAIALAQRVNRDHRIRYVCAEIEEFHPHERFDAVMMYELIEHVFDPVEVLHITYSLLRPGGILMLSTPNRCSLEARLALLKRRLRKQPLELPPFEYHVREYSLPELIAFLQDVGFHLREVEGVMLLNRIAYHLRQYPTLLRLWFKTGRPFPSIAKDLYLCAVKEET